MAAHDKLTLVIAFTLTSISTIFVALRFYSRYFLVGKLGSPDWVMLLALLTTWCSAVVNYYQVKYMHYPLGMSIPVWTDIVTKSLLTFWIYRVNYIVNLCLVKVSILLFYSYVASSHKSFHRIVRCLLALVVVASFGMLVAAICSCTPVSDAWSAKIFFESFQGIYHAKCYNPINFWFFQAGFNLVTDFVIWVLPFPFVLNLRSMPIRRRLELVGIFSVGILSVVASAIRLWILVLWVSSWEEQGTHTGDFLIWGQVEQHSGIIAASIPFLRPLIRKAYQAVPRRNQHSPAPGAKLITATPPTPPLLIRTPIIPSPSPTFGSNSSQFRAPHSPLSPIEPMRAELVRQTV
ncbi:hypothetical protein BCR34DRAFT_625268 [Clohesyomyces aquaticus]|uniref:Rhodopsin domain-containing protein n=1 Tax=Clohesyomyces aquaticus TaxID=1231657 RepID=A0A1Y1ZJL4_9PLEO|nr:hypothetical protein BCR34DRAFT_625268 [Clohesyomyces aquaticus]